MNPGVAATRSDAPARSLPIAIGESVRVMSFVAQLGIILFLARVFHIESPAFYRQVLPLALGGCLINHFLPLQHRPTFFGALGVAGILLVFGAGAGLWMVALGVMLIALCHLPVAFRWRVVALLLAMFALMALRADWIPAPWPRVLWPIFGSIFMFRVAIYLYDLKHQGPAEPGFTLAYFFLLPNIVFPLFPVIDFHTFRRTYYDRPPLEIYQEGVRWILRGFTHLILYRLIYQYVALSPNAVESTAQIVQYLVGNFGLYLRVSGQFHVAIGLLHLFGFRLPETHRFFYLASNFSDLWRRINIYWKDFMQKMVYLPVFFGLKRRGETTALVGATFAVVFATWFLHSYQWFWLLGTWLFSLTDALFWGMLGVFLVVNTIREQRRGRTRQLNARAPSTLQAWREAVQTAGMFALMCVLWGIWTSPSFEDFLVLWRAATLRPIDVAVVAATLGTVAVAAFLTRRLSLDKPSGLGARRWTQRSFLAGAAPLILLFVIGEQFAATRLPVQAQEALRDVRLVELNKYDAERLQRGYYEQLVGVNRFNGQLWEIYARAEPQEAEATATLDAMRIRRDALRTELRPLVGTIFKGGTFRTNRWGMRDRHYDLQKPPNTRRIAVMGQSYVMGSGVNDGEPFEAVVENRLNADWFGKTGIRHELLNFALPRYSLVQDAIIMENGRVPAFSPDVILVVGHGSDLRGLADYVWGELRDGRTLEPELDQWVKAAELNGDLSNPETQRRLRPYTPHIARAALRRIKAQADRIGAQALYVLIPMPTDRFEPEERSALMEAATASGLTVINMEHVFAGHDQPSLTLNPSDYHPNTAGHRVIAEGLYQEFLKHPEILTGVGKSQSREGNASAETPLLTAAGQRLR